MCLKNLSSFVAKSSRVKSFATTAWVSSSHLLQLTTWVGVMIRGFEFEFLFSHSVQHYLAPNLSKSLTLQPGTVYVSSFFNSLVEGVWDARTHSRVSGCCSPTIFCLSACVHHTSILIRGEVTQANNRKKNHPQEDRKECLHLPQWWTYRVPHKVVEYFCVRGRTKTCTTAGGTPGMLLPRIGRRQQHS